MGLLKFLFSKAFFKQLGIAILIAVLITWIAVKAIDMYTSHGREIKVPGLIGVRFDKVKNADSENNFHFLVIDSVYDDHFDKGEIILQDPPPGARVKKGRKIYVTIVASQPEMIIMPDLVDLSLRQALNELKAGGLKLDKLEYVSNFARNAVLAQKVDNDTVVAGIKILKGTPVELVLGKGLKNEKTEVPMLIGMNENEAINKITNSSLNVGYLKYLDGREKLHSRVFRQQPPGTEGQKVEYGSYVDLWFRSDLYFNFDSLIQSFSADTLRIDTLNTAKEF